MRTGRLTHFFYTGLVGALAAPVALISFAQMIDSAWALALDRAQKARLFCPHQCAQAAL